MAVDGAGTVYVADTYNNRVQAFTANGGFVSAWGGLGSGAGNLSWPRGIAVEVVERRTADGAPCCIRVEDEGPGVPLDYRETIFEAYGVVRRPDADFPQTGLGLAFCRLAVEAHGGRISVGERQPRGSVFTVELP